MENQIITFISCVIILKLKSFSASHLLFFFAIVQIFLCLQQVHQLQKTL